MSSGMKLHLLWAHGGRWVKEILGGKKKGGCRSGVEQTLLHELSGNEMCPI